MNDNQIFARYERKFILDNKQKEEFEDKHGDRLSRDENSTGTYKVYSLYFDDSNQSVIRESISNPIYKEKLRIRSYNKIPNLKDTVYLEIKKKYLKRGNKRRIKVIYGDCLDFLKHKKSLHYDDFLSNQVVNEINGYLQYHNVAPSCLISSERMAYYDQNDPNLRITFDHQIKTQFNNFTNDNGQPILDDDHWIMEVKFPFTLPLWLVESLSEMNVYSQSFSKYGKSFIQLQENSFNSKEKNK